MTETIFDPQGARSYQMCGQTLIAFARNIDDEDSLILRNIEAKRTQIIPMSRYGEFHAYPEQIGLAAIEYGNWLFGPRLTKHEAHKLADIVLNNYDLVFKYKPEREVVIEKLLERDRVVVTLNGEKVVDAS